MIVIYYNKVEIFFYCFYNLAYRSLFVFTIDWLSFLFLSNSAVKVLFVFFKSYIWIFKFSIILFYSSFMLKFIAKIALCLSYISVFFIFLDKIWLFFSIFSFNSFSYNSLKFKSFIIFFRAYNSSLIYSYVLSGLLSVL